MAVLDPTQTYTDGQKVYFKAEPPTKYNPDFHTIQAGQLGTTDPALPEEGIVMISNNPWSSPYAIYMKGVTSATPNNINGKKIPLTNTPYDFSQVLKAGWSYLQSKVDVAHIVEARYVVDDYIGEFNTLPIDPYYGYNINCPPVWFGEYWDSNHPTWGIRVYAIADMIEASGGGSFISEDLNGMTDKLTAVCFDRVDANDNLKGRYYFWCFYKPSTGKITKSIKWMGGTMYDSPLDDGGDPMAIPSLPEADFQKTGMARAYVFDGSKSSISSLNDLSTYLWGSNFLAMLDRSTSFESPLDCIIALNQLPSYEDMNKGSAEEIMCGNDYVPHYAGSPPVETGRATARVLNSQWYEVDCGTITMPSYHGNYLDYEPYTTVDLFLPYIGSVKLATKDVIGETLHIVYHCDSFSGACVCFIEINSHIAYSFNGNIITQYPITGKNFSNIIGSLVGLATGLMTANPVSALVAPTTSNNAEYNVQKASYDSAKRAEANGQIGVSLASSAINTAGNIYDSGVARSGNMCSSVGELGVRQPYAVITRRVPIVDANYDTYVGVPYFKTATLSSLSGFTIVEQVQLNGIVATQGELNEIETLLKGGVIL